MAEWLRYLQVFCGQALSPQHPPNIADEISKIRVICSEKLSKFSQYVVQTTADIRNFFVLRMIHQLEARIKFWPNFKIFGTEAQTFAKTCSYKHLGSPSIVPLHLVPVVIVWNRAWALPWEPLSLKKSETKNGFLTPILFSAGTLLQVTDQLDPRISPSILLRNIFSTFYWLDLAVGNATWRIFFLLSQYLTDSDRRKDLNPPDPESRVFVRLPLGQIFQIAWVI